MNSVNVSRTDSPSIMDQGHAKPSYHAIFHAGAEFPRFAISYRWWEDEATAVLWAFNIPAICQVIRYGLFRDENFPRNSLLSRNTDTIDAFLVNLARNEEHQLLGSLSHVQRVEEILRRSRITPFKPVAWMWFPPQPGHGQTVEEVANAIEAESHHQFRKIAFEEIVRASLGYNAPSVEWFLLQHTVLYIYLVDHLRTYPEELPLYLAVQENLRDQSPFARRALIHALRAVNSDAARNLPQSFSPGFSFIAEPVQALFKDQPPSLTTILKILSVLAIRFRRRYVHCARMEWRTPLDTSILFLEDCLNATSPRNLARTMTGTDELDFSGLARQNIITNDVFVQAILTNWHDLIMSVWECCVALPEVVPFLQECTQILLETRDYHSLTAVAIGLQRYNIGNVQSRGLNRPGSGIINIDPVLPPEVNAILNTAQNYASYRQQYQQNPGIPFLIPHLSEYQLHGESAIQDLLGYLHHQLSVEP
ncbi:hypothetical protein N7539_007725 [Penicillium diatomitis]|uniref:Ras-GEF domain-containing protein n=1 Tax=Penicillium diatomitis TaxID=2819901 RepID=A0A9X0BNJ1_9EURO|nr:uncharacterized protein N7539_007725 [Penicillium diatomitis]KAJ5475438.1 hypothetical protein N7539_007725 [Penicillium diatomitis]